MNIIQHRSPNFGPKLIIPRMLLFHSTVGTYASALEELTRADDNPVSVQYLIPRDAAKGQNATITQLVDDSMQSWGAGESSWVWGHYCNHYAIQIELANRSDDTKGLHELYPEVQIGAAVELANYLLRKHNIIPSRLTLVSHADVALPKGRKRDPIYFDMDMLRARIMELYNA